MRQNNWPQSAEWHDNGSRSKRGAKGGGKSWHDTNPFVPLQADEEDDEVEANFAELRPARKMAKEILKQRLKAASAHLEQYVQE